MTRTVWLKADDETGDWDTRKRRITAGIEAGVDWVLVDMEDVDRVRSLGDVNVAAFQGTDADIVDPESESSDDPRPDAILVGKDGEGDGTVDLPPDLSGSADLTTLRREDEVEGAFIRVTGPEYEEFAATAAHDAAYTITVADDWQVIPLENLIARVGDQTHLVTGVRTATEAETAFETLEVGADGVLIDTDDPDEIRGAVAARDEADRENLSLSWGEVVDVTSVGLADRVCVDTGSLLGDDEGMLVGSMSRGLFFVHAETGDSPYVAARPFRVNAGAVHAYARTPSGETKYLAELESGDEIQIVDREGRTREAIVGRVKIERRPMFRIAAEVDGDRVDTLLQNAETVRVATPDGRTPVTDLDEGDEVLLYVEDGGRHFGEPVEETIIER